MKEKSEDQIIRTEYSEVMQKSYIDYMFKIRFWYFIFLLWEIPG